MRVAALAFLLHSQPHFWAVRQKLCRLRDHAGLPFRIHRCHSETAHIAGECQCPRVTNETLDAFEAPASRTGWVLVYEVVAGVDLMLVKLAHEGDVTNRLIPASLPLVRRDFVFIPPLQGTEERTHR